MGTTLTLYPYLTQNYPSLSIRKTLILSAAITASYNRAGIGQNAVTTTLAIVFCASVM